MENEGPVHTGLLVDLGSCVAPLLSPSVLMGTALQLAHCTKTRN